LSLSADMRSCKLPPICRWKMKAHDMWLIFPHFHVVNKCIDFHRLSLFSDNEATCSSILGSLAPSCALSTTDSGRRNLPGEAKTQQWMCRYVFIHQHIPVYYNGFSPKKINWRTKHRNTLPR
jgi:hypothetical protein